MAGRVAGSPDSYPVRFLLCHGGRLKNAPYEPTVGREREVGRTSYSRGEFQRRSNNPTTQRFVTWRCSSLEATTFRQIFPFPEIPRVSLFRSLKLSLLFARRVPTKFPTKIPKKNQKPEQKLYLRSQSVSSKHFAKTQVVEAIYVNQRFDVFASGVGQTVV